MAADILLLRTYLSALKTPSTSAYRNSPSRKKKKKKFTFYKIILALF
jgi:hypothetical protein